MAGKWMDEGENRIANILFGSTPVDGELWLGLYKNSSEPEETATLADISEVSGSGYSRKKLTRGNWTVTGSVAEYAQQIFKALTNWGDVYGYFIATTVNDTGELLAIEHFSVPYTVEANKGIKVTPKITVS